MPVACCLLLLLAVACCCCCCCLVLDACCCCCSCCCLLLVTACCLLLLPAAAVAACCLLLVVVAACCCCLLLLLLPYACCLPLAACCFLLQVAVAVAAACAADAVAAAVAAPVLMLPAVAMAVVAMPPASAHTFIDLPQWNLGSARQLRMAATERQSLLKLPLLRLDGSTADGSTVAIHPPMNWLHSCNTAPDGNCMTPRMMRGGFMDRGTVSAWRNTTHILGCPIQAVGCFMAIVLRFTRSVMIILLRMSR